MDIGGELRILNGASPITGDRDKRAVYPHPSLNQRLNRLRSVAPTLRRVRVQTGGASYGVIVLFGSVAKGEEHDDSDLDLLLVLTDGTPLERAWYQRWQEEMSRRFEGHELSPHCVILPAKEAQIGSLWLEVAHDGIVVLDTGGFVTKFLRRVRESIASGKFVRHVTPNYSY